MKKLRSYLMPVYFLISLAGYVAVSYGINRCNFSMLISIFGVLSLCYFLIIYQTDSYSKLRWGIAAAILFRIALLFALPNLSDDFFRYIWDGNLLVHGLNPFAHTPKFYMQHGLPHFLPSKLYQQLNSQPYYTVYPPVSQYIYGLAAGLFGVQLFGNVVVMKIIMLGCEIGTFWVMNRLLDYFNLPAKYLLIYALNPLIILNLTGNLHFEGVMIFFLLLSYYLFLKQRIWLGSIAFLLAVNTKLVPLILMPYLVFSLGWKRSSKLIFVLIVGTGLLYIPFLTQTFFAHFSDSLDLYFHSFEYNASLFYLVRWLGFQIKGYDIIHTAAPAMAMISALIIIAASWLYRRPSLYNLPAIYIITMAIYYSFSTTVHPWYVTSLVAFVPLTGLLFPVVWSVFIPLTYSTYMSSAYHQKFGLIAVEYIFVFIAICWDFYNQKQSVKKKMKNMFGVAFSFRK